MVERLWRPTTANGENNKKQKKKRKFYDGAEFIGGLLCSSHMAAAKWDDFESESHRPSSLSLKNKRFVNECNTNWITIWQFLKT